MASNDLLYWYWLRDIKRIGPARAKALLDAFGSPEHVYTASPEGYLKVQGVGKDNAKGIAESKRDLEKAKVTLEREAVLAEKTNSSIMTLHDPLYPSLLKEQVAVAPPLLYVRGSLQPLSTQTIGIVGTRQPSTEGGRWAREFASRAAENGWQVVSGLALGIDAAGHQGALDAGGYTLAVLGCGIDRVYPPENRRLFEDILSSGGAIISEYPFGTPPMGDNLRKRNKITVALSRAIVIGECPLGSGTLIAAEEAFEQVKPVFAFSYPDHRKSAAGSQSLIRVGDAKAIQVSTTSDELSRSIQHYHRLKISVIFDLDGVLGDTTRLSRNALIYAIKQVEGKTLGEEEVEPFVHLSPPSALKRLSNASPEALRSAFSSYWAEKYARDLVPHPKLRGILEKIKELGMPMAVVTSRNRAHATSAIEALKLRDLFVALTTYGDTVQHKPHPAPILNALQKLSNGRQAAYVGDLPIDVEAAKAAGVVAVGATWFLDEENTNQLAQAAPDHLVKQPSELFELVLRLRRRDWSASSDLVL